MQEKNLKYWLVLHHAPLIGPMRFQKILGYYGDPVTAFEQLNTGKKSLTLPEKSFDYLRNPDWQTIEQELTWAQNDDHHIITFADEQYPDLLREIADPPAILYAIGDISLLKRPQIAIVGSRNPSKGGKENALNFARFLGNCGFTITSGLALGIDGEAHRGGLNTKGSTVAITGTGLARVYPARHKPLAHEIIASDGLLLSEYPLKTQALKENFPRRNRLISGLSLGTLVIEAAQQSGSLITARLAGEQGREVFAIPGSIHNPLAKGCHHLIRQGAKLVETAEHIVEELGHMVQWSEKNQNADTKPPLPKNNLTPEALELLEIAGFDPISIDAIVERSGLTPESVSSILLVLELQGYIESLAGGAYTRIN